MNITYRTAWKAIAARVAGVESAARLHAAFLAVNQKSIHGVDKHLAAQVSDIWNEIELFVRSYEKTLPARAKSAVERFRQSSADDVVNLDDDAMRTRSFIVKMMALSSEISFLLDDPMERVRSTAELAFMHLQRLIAVDADYRSKWEEAFGKSEPQCERLGGTQLLWHGIWAFKVDAAGGRTDLVYQEKMALEAAPVPLGLVLTEWKKTNGNPDRAYREAREQAEAYSSGALAGLELTSHRYLVVVTQNQHTPPSDLVLNGVTYRHINIAVSPVVPSAFSRRST